MDIAQRLEVVRRHYNITTDLVLRELIVDVLQEVLDAGHDLGGMGEYGRGWNDRGEQIRIIVKEMIERWKSEN